MKLLNFKYQYFALFFIFLFITIGSVAATEDFSMDNNVDSSSEIIVSSINDNHESVNSFSNSIVDENKTLNHKEINTIESNQITNNKKDDKAICSVSTSKNIKTILSSKSLIFDYGTNKYVVGYLKTSSGEAISGKVVTITINSRTWNKTTDSNGKVGLKIDFDPNIYPVEFSFSGGFGYSASSCSVNVTVNQISTKIIASDLYVYNDNVLVAHLKDSKNNYLKNKLVKFIINGSSFNAFTDSNGKVSFNIPNYLESKTYSSIIKFVGDRGYSSSSKSIKIYKFNEESIGSFISEFINSLDFNNLIDNDEFDLVSNKNPSNVSELEFNLFENMNVDEINSINQFLNLINSNGLDLSNSNYFKNITTNSKEIDNDNILEYVWKWLNTPILEIPGYADLDEKYGLLGQGLKLAGWFLLGIDDNGGLTPLDIGLDALSICSGLGLAEHLGLSTSSLVLKFADKFPRFNNLLKASVKIKGLDYLITVKSLFNAYKSSLSLLNNPIKFVSNKIITNVLDKSESKLASFAMEYISNSFLTVSSVLGITEGYVNAKDNSLFVRNLISSLKSGSSIDNIINSSQSSIASTIKNIKTTSNDVSKVVKSVSNKVTETLTNAKKAVSSSYNTLTKTVKSSDIYKAVTNSVNTVKNTVKEVANSIKSTITKSVNTVKNTVKKVSNTVNSKVTKSVNTVKKAVSTVKKTVVSTSKKVVKAVSSFVNKIKFF